MCVDKSTFVLWKKSIKIQKSLNSKESSIARTIASNSKKRKGSSAEHLSQDGQVTKTRCRRKKKSHTPTSSNVSFEADVHTRGRPLSQSTDARESFIKDSDKADQITLQCTFNKISRLEHTGILSGITKVRSCRSMRVKHIFAVLPFLIQRCVFCSNYPFGEKCSFKRHQKFIFNLF